MRLGRTAEEDVAGESKWAEEMERVESQQPTGLIWGEGAVAPSWNNEEGRIDVIKRDDQGELEGKKKETGMNA